MTCFMLVVVFICVMAQLSEAASLPVSFFHAFEPMALHMDVGAPMGQVQFEGPHSADAMEEARQIAQRVERDIPEVPLKGLYEGWNPWWHCKKNPPHPYQALPYQPYPYIQPQPQPVLPPLLVPAPAPAPVPVPAPAPTQPPAPTPAAVTTARPAVPAALRLI